MKYKFTIVAHNGPEGESKILSLATSICLEASSAKEAVLKAKRIIKAKNYWVQDVKEIYEATDYTPLLEKMIKKL